MAEWVLQVMERLGRLLDQGPETSPARRMLVSALAIALLCVICLPFFTSQFLPAGPPIVNGSVSMKGVVLDKRPVLLSGDWNFRWNSALGSTPAGAVPPFTMPVPGVWNGKSAPDDQILPHRGEATYSLSITDLAPGRYRISFPTIFLANEVRLNGELISSRGVIGPTPETTRYVWRAQDVAFDADGKPMKLEVRMASRLHRDNGFDGAPAIGKAEAIHDYTNHRMAQEFLTQVALMTIGLFCLTVYLYRARDPSFLYFSIAAFALMPASLMLGFDNLLTMAFPSLPFGTMIVIVYLSACVSVGVSPVYVHSIYPAESPRLAFRLLMGVMVVFTLGQIAAFVIGGTYLGSRYNVLIVPIMLIMFSYLLFVIGRAAWRKRDGAFPFMIGVAVFVVAMSLTAMIASGLISRETFGPYSNSAFGILILLFSHIVVLSERWSQSIRSSEAMTDDLRQLIEVNSSITSEMELESLLAHIVEVNSRIVRAERSSLFLIDPKTNELWSMVAEGLGHRAIRIAQDQGIVGHVFATGQPAIIENAYRDPRFSRAVDETTGYKTRNLIAVPITTREGRKLGVLQALNRRGDGRFDDADLIRMRAFAAQAAIALDNATLFSEVIESRNYNESILGSMSSAVVTLDPDLRVAKFNTAACTILRVTEERLAGADVRTGLALRNAGLLAEIESVAATGTPRTLIDYPIVNGKNTKASANIAIVPLTGQNGPIGILMIVDDISAGKRLQGAMRRFMPQEVMEEVLGREDDLMFGTACNASVLFADIRNFTSMAETLNPRQTVDMLNEIFTELFEAVADAGGVLDKYIGDAVMAVFGAPLSRGADAENAVRAALQMQRMMRAINERRMARGQPPLRLGIGIASGDVVAGTIGSPKRMDYTVIGDSVNLAARLQDLTKTYDCDIILCERTAALVSNFAHVSELDQIQVRGRVQQERIFEAVA